MSKRAPTSHRGVVLVTGCSSGIGLETAVTLSQRGFRVFATMRDLDRRRELDEAARRRNAPVEVLQLDVTDPSSVHRAVENVVRDAGSIYGLVNNAGRTLRGYFEDLTDSEIRQVFDTNVFGTMTATRAVLPHMRTESRGRIVVMSSIGGRIGSPALSAYCASKFSLEGVAESLALESRPRGIEVSIVEPGVVQTEIWRRNRGVAEGALDPDSPFAPWFRETERLADRFVRTAVNTPADVADVVFRALTARRPRLRYVVGRRARLVLRLRDYLPGESFERLYFGALLRRVTGGKRTEPR